MELYIILKTSSILTYGRVTGIESRFTSFAWRHRLEYIYADSSIISNMRISTTKLEEIHEDLYTLAEIKEKHPELII